jgi:hypothetical protein
LSSKWYYYYYYYYHYNKSINKTNSALQAICMECQFIFIFVYKHIVIVCKKSCKEAD